MLSIARYGNAIAVECRVALSGHPHMRSYVLEVSSGHRYCNVKDFEDERKDSLLNNLYSVASSNTLYELYPFYEALHKITWQ
jgi:hypothetical protein